MLLSSTGRSAAPVERRAEYVRHHYDCCEVGSALSADPEASCAPG